MGEDITAKGNAKFLAFAHSFYEEAISLMAKKNQDYANSEDPLKNFRLVEHLGVVNTDKAIFVRLSDKFSRLAKFVKTGSFAVEDEKVRDTLLDLCNYAVFLAYYYSEINEEQATIEDDLEKELVILGY